MSSASVNVTIQEDMLPVVIGTDTPKLTITDTRGITAVIEAEVIKPVIAEDNIRLIINNGGYSGTVSVLLDDLLGKLTRNQMTASLAVDLERLEALWNRVGTELLLTYPEGLEIQEAGRNYTDSSITDAVTDITLTTDGKIAAAYSVIEQNAAAITQTVVSLEGNLTGRFTVNESLISQTSDRIDSVVSHLDTIDGPGGSVELLQSSISQTAEALSLEVSARELTDGNLIESTTNISLLSDTLTLFSESLDSLGNRVTTSEIILGDEGIHLTVLQEALSDHEYSIGTFQSVLTNQWGVTIKEDISGNKYAAGFGLILHPVWLMDTEYIVDSLVYYVDTVYKCILNHTASAINSPGSTNTATYWEEVPEGTKSAFTIQADAFNVLTPNGVTPVFSVTEEGVTLNGDLAATAIESSNYGTPGEPWFRLDSKTGLAEFNGMVITIGSGSSGYSNFSDAPTSLADINPGEYAILQNSIETHFYDGVPTLSNLPASGWTTDAVKDAHLGDMYYDGNTGTGYRFSKYNGVYSWEVITDSASLQALALAQDAYDVATDHKRRIFLPGLAPLPPYDVGDLWATGTTDGIKSCSVARAAGASYVATDWEISATKGADWETNVSNIPYDTVYNNDDSVAMGFNPTFSDWADTVSPTGWNEYIIAPQKETSIVRVGKYSAKWVVPAGSAAGMSCSNMFVTSPLPVGTFISGSFDVYIESYVGPGKPGIAVDLYYNTASQYIRTYVPATSTETGIWQRIPFSARLSSTQRIYGIRIFIFASYSGLPGGLCQGTIIFDNLRFALFDSTTDNKAITINSNGALSGAGSGQVTITGLGYTGALNATYGALPSEITALQNYAVAQDNLVKTIVNAYADDVANAAELAAIAAAQAKADAAENNAKIYADGEITASEAATQIAYEEYADAAENAAIVTANAYADGKITIAEQAIITSANAYTDAAKLVAITTSNAYADGIADQAELDAIAAANAYADAAKNVAIVTANAYADGIVTAEEQRAIADASAKALAAQAAAQAYTEAWSEEGADVTDYTKTSTVQLLNGTAYSEVIGNTAIKTGGTNGWNVDVYSSISFSGGARVRFKAITTNKYFMLGLNTDPLSGADYTLIDYAIQSRLGSSFIMYESGVQKGVLKPCTVDTVFEIIYTGSEVIYIADNITIRSVPAAPGLTLYIDSSLDSIGAGFKVLSFEPYATNGADWATNITNKPTLGALAGLDLITDTVITDHSISAQKINAINLAALSANLGNVYVDSVLEVDSAGHINSTGKADYLSTTSGYFLGNYDGQPALNIGDATKYIKYRNGVLAVGGNIIATGNIVEGAVTGLATTTVTTPNEISGQALELCAQLTCQSFGKPIQINATVKFSLSYYKETSYMLELRLYRLTNTAVLLKTINFQEYKNDGGTFYWEPFMYYIDNVAAGTYTYQLIAYDPFSSDPRDITMLTTQMALVEAKR